MTAIFNHTLCTYCYPYIYVKKGKAFYVPINNLRELLILLRMVVTNPIIVNSTEVMIECLPSREQSIFKYHVYLIRSQTIRDTNKHVIRKISN